MSYLGDVHRSRSFEAAGGVAIQRSVTTPISASIGRAIPPQATVASEPGSKWAASIEKVNAAVRSQSSSSSAGDR